MTRMKVAVVLWCLAASLAHGQRREQRWAFENLADPKNSDLAVHTLATIGRPAMPMILRILKTREAGNRVRYDKTIQVCGKIGPEAADAVPFLIAELEPNAHPVIRKESIKSLGMIGPAAAKAVPSLRKILQAEQDMHSEFDITIKALEQIGPGAQDAYPELIALIKRGRSADKCAMAIASIGAPAAEVIPSLIERLDKMSGAGVSPTGAARALGHFGPLAKEALPALRVKVAAAFETDEMNIWGRFAIAKIENSGKSDEIPQLIQRLHREFSPRADIVRALGELGPLASAAVPDLIRYVDPKANSQPNSYGWHSIVALGNIGPAAKAAVPLLIEIVEEQREADRGHEPIRSVAIEALGKIGRVDSRVLPALKEVAKSDSDPIMRLLAMKTVKVAAKVDPPKKRTAGLRVWSDIDGKDKIKASFVKITQRDVVLDTDTGKTINVPITKLSKTDLDYLSKKLKVKIPTSAGTDLLAGRDRVALEGHTDFVHCVRFSPDGEFLATCSHDKTIKIWDAATGDIVGEMEVEESVNVVSFSPDGKWLMSGGYDQGNAYLWDYKTGKKVKDLAMRAGKISGAKFSPDGRLVKFDTGSGVHIIEVAKGKFAAPFPKYDYRKHSFLDFSPDNNILMSLREDRWHVMVVDWAKARRGFGIDDAVKLKVDTIRGTAKFKYLYGKQFSPNGLLVAANTPDDKKVHLWDAVTGDLITSFDHQLNPLALAFSHDSKLIAVSGNTNNRGKGGDVVIWEIASRKVVARFGRELDEINSIDFSPDGNTLATTTKDYMDSRVFLWNLRRKITK